jgi:hypothetical protein
VCVCNTLCMYSYFIRSFYLARGGQNVGTSGDLSLRYSIKRINFWVVESFGFSATSVAITIFSGRLVEVEQTQLH